MQAADLTVPFDIDDYTRWRLLEGLDDIGLTLRHADERSPRSRAARPRAPAASHHSYARSPAAASLPATGPNWWIARLPYRLRP